MHEETQKIVNKCRVGLVTYYLAVIAMLVGLDIGYIIDITVKH